MAKGLSIAACTAAAFLAAAPAAHATAVPFDVHYVIGEQELRAGVTYSEELPTIGTCGEDTCTGVRATVGVSPVTAQIGWIQLTLRGWLCVTDASPSCSPDGVPFTGLRLTERVMTSSAGRADLIPIDVSFCLWGGGWHPLTCSDGTSDGLEIDGIDDVTDVVPPSLGVAFES